MRPLLAELLETDGARLVWAWRGRRRKVGPRGWERGEGRQGAEQTDAAEPAQLLAGGAIVVLAARDVPVQQAPHLQRRGGAVTIVPTPPPLVYHEGQAACCGPSCNSRDFIGVARLARWDAVRPARCCSPTTLCSGVPACSDATRSGRMSHGVGTGGTLGVGLGCTSGFASAHISEPAVVRVAETRRVRCSAAHSRHVLHSACDLSDMSVDVPRAGVLGERRNFRGKQMAIGRSRVCRAEIRRGARSGVALSSCPHRDSIRGIAFPRPQMAVSDMGLDKAEHLLGLCAGRVGADVACAVEGVHE